MGTQEMCAVDQLPPTQLQHQPRSPPTVPPLIQLHLLRPPSPLLLPTPLPQPLNRPPAGPSAVLNVMEDTRSAKPMPGAMRATPTAAIAAASLRPCRFSARDAALGVEAIAAGPTPCQMRDVSSCRRTARDRAAEAGFPFRGFCCSKEGSIDAMGR